MIRLSRENARAGRAIGPVVRHDAVLAPRELQAAMPSDYNAPLRHTSRSAPQRVLLRRIVGRPRPYLSRQASERMLTRTIPSSGEALPLIGLGTYRAFDAGASAAQRAALAEVLKTLAACGGRMVDSSPMYGRAESVVGDLQAQLGLRPQLFLATKVWTSGRDAGIRQMQRSLQSMQAGTMDLMQIHNLVDVHTHTDTLEEWKRQGLAGTGDGARQHAFTCRP